MLHNLPPKHPQTSLFFPTAPRHHRTVGPQTHKCCNYLSLSSILFSPSSSYPLASSLPFPPLTTLPIPWQSAFIRSLWCKLIVTKVSGSQPQRPFRGPAVCALHLSSLPRYSSSLHLPLHSCSLPKSWAHLCCFYSQLRPLQTPMSVFSWAVYFSCGQPLLKSPLSKMLQMSLFFSGQRHLSCSINMCVKWALHID